MNNRLLGLLIASLFIISVFSAPTMVSYIVEVEQQQRQDFLQVTFSTNAQDSSLESAIKQAKTQAQNLKRQAEQICKQLIKDKKSCKQIVQIGSVQIEPSYKEQKKDTIYEKVKVSYEVVITWKDIKNFGGFVDQLLKVQGIVIEKIQWQPDEDLVEKKFLSQSVAKSSDLCAQLGKNFIRVVNVEELRDQPEKPEEQPPAEEGEEEEEQQEQPEEEEPEEEEEDLDSYKITIECDGVLAKKSKKK